MFSNSNSPLVDLLPETIEVMKELGVGETRDKWSLDSIPVGGHKLIKASDMPSKNWTGPAVSESQKKAGLRISVRKTKKPEIPLMIIRTA